MHLFFISIMEKLKIDFLVKSASIAALYAVLTWLLDFDTTNLRFKNKYLSISNMLAFALAAVGIVLYFAYPMFQTVADGKTINNSICF